MDTLKAMKIFAAVVEEGTMSAAARRLGIANSVVTKNLNELEAWLGRKLMYRSTRSVKPSHEGVIYYEQIRDIIGKVDDLERLRDADNQVLSGDVTVTAPVILGKAVLCPLLPGFTEMHPGVRIRIALNNDVNDMVEEGIDLALRISRLPDSSLIARRLCQMRVVFVASPDYLERHPAPKVPDGLKAHACLIDGSIADSRKWIFRSKDGRNRTISVDGPFDINDAEAVVELCRKGTGVAYVPEHFVRDDLAAGSLIELLPDYATTDVFISLLYHPRGMANPSTKAFYEYLVEELTEII